MEAVSTGEYERISEDNEQNLGSILDMTLQQVEMSYDLDQQQEASSIKSNSQQLLDQQSKRQVLMESVSQTQNLLDKVQGLVWLAQSLTQADTEVTQETLDSI